MKTAPVLQGGSQRSNGDSKAGKTTPARDLHYWAVSEDGPDLASTHTLFSQTLGTCIICSWRPPNDRGKSRQEHLEHHRWELSPEGQRTYGRLRRIEEQAAGFRARDGSLLLHRRLGCLLWRLRERGHSVPQITRDLRLPLALVQDALAIPERQWEAVQHLHRQGLLAAEIADQLGISLKAVDRQLRETADWDVWLDSCCPPGWGRRPLLEPAGENPW
jgi:hypothetical protein